LIFSNIFGSASLSLSLQQKTYKKTFATSAQTLIVGRCRCRLKQAYLNCLRLCSSIVALCLHCI